MRLARIAARGHLDLQVWQRHVGLSFRSFLRALTVFGNPRHERARIILDLVVFLDDPLDLIVQLLDKFELVIGYLVLLLQLVVFKLEAADGHFEQLVLPLRLHGARLIELVLRLLSLVLFLPILDLLSQFLFDFVLLLVLTAQLRNGALKLLDLDVFDLGVLLGPEFFHGLEQLLLFPLDLDIVRGHVLVLVLLEHL